MTVPSREPEYDITLAELADLAAKKLYICPACETRNRHPEEVLHLYCGRCHKFELDYDWED